MGQVKLYNENVHVLKEKFRGEDIVIPPGGFVHMDEDDAVLFRGQFSYGMVKDAQDQPDPRYFKMVRIVRDEDATAEAPKKFISMLDGKEFASQAELDNYLKLHEDRVFKDEVLDQELEKKAAAKKR